jgi:pimeloyl-ACP methyl ester carboxylesterase
MKIAATHSPPLGYVSMTRISILFLFIVMIVAPRLSAQSDANPSHFVALDKNLKVHYSTYGQGKPTLVFVHGWAGDETVWSGQTPELAKEMRCITIDLPGHGQSDKPEISYTMHLYARAIDAVLRHAKVDSAVIVGHSNGTTAIRQFYREFPKSVSALVIVDGGLRPRGDAASMKKFLAPFRGPDYPKAAGKFIDSIIQPIKDDALRQRIKTTMLKTPQRVAVSEFENVLDPELWKEDPISVPTLMVMAKQPAWNNEYKQFVQWLVPKVDYQVWDNVSHFLMMEKPKEFNDAVTSFLKTNKLLEEKAPTSSPTP